MAEGPLLTTAGTPCCPGCSLTDSGGLCQGSGRFLACRGLVSAFGDPLRSGSKPLPCRTDAPSSEPVPEPPHRILLTLDPPEGQLASEPGRLTLSRRRGQTDRRGQTWRCQGGPQGARRVRPADGSASSSAESQAQPPPPPTSLLLPGGRMHRGQRSASSEGGPLTFTSQTC